MNSTFWDEEIAQYKEKTKFMVDIDIREDGCNLFNPYDKIGSSNPNVLDKDQKQII